MSQNRIFVCALYIAILCMPQYVGAQYSPAFEGDVYREEGNASWYGEEFNGRPTASGEIFDSTRLTAAHRTLPFGTFLIITNKNNNRQVTVKVNDRGPFIEGRVIDISKAAAEHIDMVNAGTVPVVIETMPTTYLPPPVALAPPDPEPQPEPVVEEAPLPVAAAHPEPPEAAPAMPYPPITINVYSTQTQEKPQTQPHPSRPMKLPPEPAPPPPMLYPVEPPPLPGPAIKLIPDIKPLPGSTYRIQVGSYKVPRYAVEAFDKLKGIGLNPSYEPYGEMYRVVLAKIPGTEVFAVTEKLAKAGFREALIREER